MPELPEVETVRVGLKKLIVGKIVSGVSYDWQKSFPNSKQDVQTFLISAIITDVRRRAKVLIIDLSTKYSLVIHLKMTGQLVFVPVVQKQEGLGVRNWELGKNNFAPLPITRSPYPPAESRFGAGHPNDSLIGKLPDKSTRVTIEFSDKSHLYFNDQRKFGWMRLVPTEIIDLYATGSMLESSARRQGSAQKAVHTVPRAITGAGNAAIAQELSRPSKLELVAGKSGIEAVVDFMKKVGPEPLESDFTYSIFVNQLMHRKKSQIKPVLIDQTVIAGIGNIYADESLFMAGIHPESNVYKIPKTKLKILHRAIIDVLNLSIEKGGSTDRNYVNAEGKKGSYIEFAKVFRQENQPCPNNCGKIITKIRVAGRGTHICVKCQKRYPKQN
ncbi:MAG: hypothetical protein MUF85_02420 [Patescibacteria group bacterium]|jgi:formamidopyrimidine-DNA glycosylase|nr:hypothetical protein [Patescibacteria group bacterium]